MVKITELDIKTTPDTTDKVIIQDTTTKQSTVAGIRGINDSAPSASTTYSSNKIDTELATKSSTGHTHDDRYYTETETNALLAGKSSTGHTHDDRYYTESEVNTLLAGKSDTGHIHTNLPKTNVVTGTITFDDTALPNVTIAHGLGQIPKYITGEIEGNNPASEFMGGLATYDGSTIKQKVWNSEDNVYENKFFIWEDSGSLDEGKRAISAIDATNITLSYSYIGTFGTINKSYVITFIG